MNIKKPALILGGIVLLGLALRLIVANNLHINSDETVYTVHALGFINSGRLSVLEQSPAYYTILDATYSLFGNSAITSRLPSIIGGTLSIILVFLITQHFYDRRTGLLAAFFTAVSGFLLSNFVEMDALMYFFILLSFYLLIRATDKESVLNKELFFCMSAYVVAVLIKPLAIPAIVPLVVYYFYKKSGEKIMTHLKVIGLFVLLSLVMLSPILTHNYLLYKEKKVTDIFFSQYLGLNLEEYRPYGAEKEWNFTYFKEKLKKNGKQLFSNDFFIALFSPFGLFFSLRKRNPSNVLLLPLLFVYLYFVGITGSPNHYIIIVMVLAIYAAQGVVSLLPRLDRLSLSLQQGLVIFGVLVLLVNAVSIQEQLTEKASTNTLREYFSTITGDDILVVYDPRMYLGSAQWVLSDLHAVKGVYFVDHLAKFNAAGIQQNKSVELYYIECTTGDCGWGRGTAENEQAQQTGNQITDLFKKQAEVVTTFSDNLERGSYDYTVYHVAAYLPPGYLNEVDRGRSYFSYWFRYKEDERAFDYIERKNLGWLETALYSFSLLMLRLDSLLAVGMILLVGYLVIDWNRDVTENVLSPPEPRQSNGHQPGK